MALLTSIPIQPASRICELWLKHSVIYFHHMSGNFRLLILTAFLFSFLFRKLDSF